MPSKEHRSWLRKLPLSSTAYCRRNFADYGGGRLSFATMTAGIRNTGTSESSRPSDIPAVLEVIHPANHNALQGASLVVAEVAAVIHRVRDGGDLRGFGHRHAGRRARHGGVAGYLQPRHKHPAHIPAVLEVIHPANHNALQGASLVVAEVAAVIHRGPVVVRDDDGGYSKHRHQRVQPAQRRAGGAALRLRIGFSTAKPSTSPRLWMAVLALKT
jgi:hypothetical protein